MGGRWGVAENTKEPFRVGSATASITLQGQRGHQASNRSMAILCRHHSLNCDIGSTKCLPEKQTSSHWPVQRHCMCIDSA